MIKLVEPSEQYIKSYIEASDEYDEHDVPYYGLADARKIDILEDFDQDRGIGSIGYERLSKGIDDAWEFAHHLGEKNTGILELYMLAFKLAMKQLSEVGCE